MKIKFFVAIVASAALLAGVLPVHAQSVPETAPLKGVEATVYKSPTCGCCSNYVEYLKKHGATVEVMNVNSAELAKVKQDKGVPGAAQGCHTVLLEGYVVEGHVPLKALSRLLAERPKMDGIALPGMPTGSPGMSGPKTAPFEIYRFDGGKLGLFATL